MAMTYIWAGMIGLSLLFGTAGAVIGDVSNAALEGAGAAVELCLSLAGTLCLWSGIMEILRACGLADLLAKGFHPILRRLFPQAANDPDTLFALSANVSANLLGLGNAATPMGLKVAERMARGCGGTATDELCRLIVLNTSSIQLLPTTIASVRAACGAKAPFDILPAVWLASIGAVTSGLLMSSFLRRVWRN